MDFQVVQVSIFRRILALTRKMNQIVKTLAIGITYDNRLELLLMQAH